MPARLAPKSKYAEIKAAYLRGDGSCAVLAKKFDLPTGTIARRCQREGWKKDVCRISEEVCKTTRSKVLDAATSWVDRIRKSCERDMERIDATYTQLDPAADPIAVRCLTQARKTVDDMMRRALQLPDSPQPLQHSGSIAIFSEEIQSEAAEAWTLLRTEIIRTGNPKNDET